MTSTAEALSRPDDRSVSIDTLPMAPDVLGLRPGPRVSATGARAVWWQLRSLKPAAALAVLSVALTPLIGALWLGSRTPQTGSEELRLSAPGAGPAIPRPSDADHSLHLRRDKLSPAAPPEGFYGAAGRGGPVESWPTPEAAPAPGGLMAPPAETAWRPEGRLQAVGFQGAAGIGGGGGQPGGALTRAERKVAAVAAGAGAATAPAPRKFRGEKQSHPPAAELAVAAPAARAASDVRTTDGTVYSITTDLHAAYLTNGPGATDELNDPDGWRWRPQTFGVRDARTGMAAGARNPTAREARAAQ